MAAPFPTGLLLGEPEADVLLGEKDLPRDERKALMRRHSAALKVVRQLPTSAERIELLRAVVWPTDGFREKVAAIDAGEKVNF